MSRRNARELAMKILYSKDLNPETESIEAESLQLTPKDASFSKALVAAETDHEGEIDSLIAKHLKNWSIEELNVVDKTILRMSLAEALFMEESSDAGLVINEAVELARKYGGENSYRFINGILDSVLAESAQGK
ncbi:MAG: transcription antitermination factor NusB [Dialister sp.]|nr:transcription antitermination factor NusB [Dialister sp.]